MVRTVLIVDDNPSIRQSLCELFTRQGDFDVWGEAENGREAIDRAQQFHPDLIVMDLSMPVMNSLDAARVLRRLMRAVLRIMFGAYCDACSVEAAFSARVSLCVTKYVPL